MNEEQNVEISLLSGHCLHPLSSRENFQIQKMATGGPSRKYQDTEPHNHAFTVKAHGMSSLERLVVMWIMHRGEWRCAEVEQVREKN